MTTHKRLILGTQKFDTSKPLNTETLITSPSNRDWDSLVGLLLMLSLTGLAAVSMVVDISVVRQAFRTIPPSPQESQQQIAGQSTMDSFQ